jgi:SWI/SNF-related matrix-associated actin-dependent regulator 1 of chromatin subfamily A
MNLTLPNGTKTTLPDIALQWKNNGVVHTQHGARHLFSSPLPMDWWHYWKDHKDELKKHGISCNKDQQGVWFINCWMIPASGANVAHFSDLLLERSRASAPSGSFAAVLPEGVKPYPYQAAGVQYALTRPRCIIGDDMGLGKSLQAIATCNHIKAINILIVCPASLRLNWRDEFSKFSTHPSLNDIAVLSKSDIPQIASCNVVYISYDMMITSDAQKQLRSRKWDCIIVDEAHYLKNKEAKRSEHLLGLPPRSRKKGITEPLQSDRWLFLTGTPVSNRPEDFWNLLRFCAPEHFGVWTKFALRYCDGKPTPFGKGMDTSGSSNLEELQTLVRGSCMVRRLKRDVLTQLPAKTRKIVALPTPDEIVQELDTLTLEYRTSEETVAKMKQKLAEAKSAGNAAEFQEATEQLKSAQNALFNETSRIRKQIGLSKVALAIEHITNALGGGGKVIVGAHHRDVIEQLVAGLSKFNAVVVTGGTPPELRHQRVQIFQNDPTCKLFIGNILAAGTGLTLTASPHVVIVEPDWVPANNAQFEDRAHRIGQSKPVLIEYLAMEKTIDIQVLRANARKMDVIERATDNENKVEMDPTAINYGIQSPAHAGKTVSERIAEESQQEQRKMATIALGKSLSPRELMIAHQCVKKVAILDGDRAQAKNDVGFSKLDSEYGALLARKRLQDLTDLEKGRVAKLAWKYRRQCPEELVAQLKNPKEQS